MKKALYGLKRAPKAWYERLRDFLTDKGLKIGSIDNTLFIKHVDDDLFICQIYVDDIIFSSTNEVYNAEFRDLMAKEFEMSMIGELHLFLGFHVKQMKKRTFIYKEKYTRDLLKRFGMDSTPIKTPMATNGIFGPDKSGKPVDKKLYRSMIGSPLYLTASRSVIMFSVCLCACYQANTKESYLSAVKRILR